MLVAEIARLHEVAVVEFSGIDDPTGRAFNELHCLKEPSSSDE